MRAVGESSESQNVFANIWEACSNMNGYVQMHITNTEMRKTIFGDSWNNLPSEEWAKYIRNGKLQNPKNTASSKISDIIKNDYVLNENYVVIKNEKQTKVLYKSIIEFPVFLLHCLKCFVQKYNVVHENGEVLVFELLDDKRLIDSFDRVICHGLINGNKIDPVDFSKKFIILLLRTRFLFDKFIIKRMYDDVNVDGVWSLNELRLSSNDSSGYYSQTRFINYKEWNQNDKILSRNKEILMIQSALRVSYTSPKVMHWITSLLNYLLNYEDVEYYMADFCKVIEDIAKKAVKDNFLSKCKNDVYELGVNTPHIVFNYLDYLLWKNNKEKYKDFVFEFRNSVEHWYPQNPSDGSFDSWVDGKDTFGNLCIIQRDVNSKFSNLSPGSKKETYINRINKGSIKLRIMSEMTVPGNNKVSSYYWREDACKIHEKKMIEILKDNCTLEQ